MTRPLPGRLVAEAAGTAFLVGVGTGAIVLAAQHGGISQVAMALAWFVAVAVPVVALARISGAHLNPAVTVMLAGSGRFPVRETGPYLGAQVVGGFAGSFSVWVGVGRAAHLGATVPNGIGLVPTFVMELGFTVLLLASVVYLTEPGRSPRTWELLLPATAVGLSTYLIGPWTGSSLNPARTVAPAVLSGEYAGIGTYFVAAACAAVLVALLVRWSRTRSPANGSGRPPSAG